MRDALAEILDGPEVEILGWVLFHSLWINAAIAAGLILLLLALRRRSASLRYWLCVATLCLMVAAPVGVFGYLCHTARTYSDTAAVTRLSQSLKVAVASVRAFPSHDGRKASGDELEPIPEAIPVQRNFAITLMRIQPWLRWICVVWASIIVLLLLRQLVGWYLLQRLLKQDSTPVRSPFRRLRRLARRLGVPHVQFRETRVLTEPAAAGLQPAVVLLPSRLLVRLNSRQLDAVVAHELAHVRRYDYLVNLVQVAMESLLIYHPAVWWISARIRQERENCCDDVAAEAVGDRVLYARALADAVDRMSQMPPLALHIGGGVLLPRILRLVGDPRAQPRHASSGLAASLVTLVLILVGGSHLLASTNALREARAWQNDRPLGDAIYEVLGLPRGAAFLPALAHAVQAGAEIDPGGPAMRQLVTALNVSSSPRALSDAALPRMESMGSGIAHMSRPDWPYGNLAQHRAMSDSMWDQAEALQQTAPTASKEYARAALLLEVQDGFWSGFASLHWRLSRPRAQQLMGLNDAQFQQLWAHQSVYQRIFDAYSAYFSGPFYDLTEMKPSGQAPDRQSVVDAVALLEQMSVFGSNRPEIQWRIAEHLWRLRASSGATMDLLLPLKQTVLANVGGYGAEHFRRWIDLALTVPPPQSSTMAKRYTEEEAKKLFWPAPE